jgi:hypothetical protein
MEEYKPLYNETRTAEERRAWQGRLDEIIGEGGPWMNDVAFDLISNAVDNDIYRNNISLVIGMGTYPIFNMKAFLSDTLYAYGLEDSSHALMVLEMLYYLENANGPSYGMEKQGSIDTLSKFDYVSASIVERLEEMKQKYPYAPMLSTTNKEKQDAEI